MEKSENLWLAGENVNWCSCCGKQSGGSSKSNPGIPILGVYIKEWKPGSQICVPIYGVHSFVHNSQEVRNTFGVDTMEHYSALKRKGMLAPVITWMNLEDTALSEINQTQTDK